MDEADEMELQEQGDALPAEEEPDTGHGVGDIPLELSDREQLLAQHVAALVVAEMYHLLRSTGVVAGPSVQQGHVDVRAAPGARPMPPWRLRRGRGAPLRGPSSAPYPSPATPNPHSPSWTFRDTWDDIRLRRGVRGKQPTFRETGAPRGTGLTEVPESGGGSGSFIEDAATATGDAATDDTLAGDVETHATSVIPGIDAVDPELPEAGEVDHTVGNDGPVLVAAVRPGVKVDTVETVERDSVADTAVGPVVSDVGEPSDVVEPSVESGVDLLDPLDPHTDAVRAETVGAAIGDESSGVDPMAVTSSLSTTSTTSTTSAWTLTTTSSPLQQPLMSSSTPISPSTFSPSTSLTSTSSTSPMSLHG